MIKQQVAPRTIGEVIEFIKKMNSLPSQPGVKFLTSLFEAALGNDNPPEDTLDSEGVDVVTDNLCGATILIVGTRREVLDAQLWLTLRLDDQISKRRAEAEGREFCSCSGCSECTR